MTLTLIPYTLTPTTKSAPEPAPAGLTAHELSAAPDAPPETLVEKTTRHDGWSGERMATFLETLADTGIVTDAARAADMSSRGAYRLRSRDPVFAAAWRAAEVNARPVVADGLLERSITGTVEHYYRDGVLVGERRHYESWLGLAVLKRLDRLADEDRADDTLASRIAGDWPATLDLLRAGGTDAVDATLGDKVREVPTPPSPPGWDDQWDRCWRDDDTGAWRTNFAPPPGFAGDENREWNGFDAYTRACTPEEGALLDAHEAALEAGYRAELAADAADQRDTFFAMVRDEILDCPPSPSPASERGLG